MRIMSLAPFASVSISCAWATAASLEIDVSPPEPSPFSTREIFLSALQFEGVGVGVYRGENSAVEGFVGDVVYDGNSRAAHAYDFDL